jgi:hypothetical protein
MQCFPVVPPGDRNFQPFNRAEGFIKLSGWVWGQKIGTGSGGNMKRGGYNSEQNVCSKSFVFYNISASHYA